MLLKRSYKPSGVTLLEIMLSMAILAVIAVSSLPFFVTLISKSKLDSARLLTAQALRRASVKAQSGEANTDWGVMMRPDKIVVFSGSSYEHRNGQYDNIAPLDGGVGFAGDTEIVFGKLTSTLAMDKTVILTLLASGEIKTVTVSAEGAVNY